MKDTQLSYAGLRDPGTVSPVYDGNIWGGVIATGGGVRLDIGNEKSGLYVSGGGSDLTGYHVLENRKYEGTMGAYFRAKQWPGYGNLNIGTSFFGMHYDHNERGMTYGQGGYFSPAVYFLAAVPITYTGYFHPSQMAADNDPIEECLERRFILICDAPHRITFARTQPQFGI